MAASCDHESDTPETGAFLCTFTCRLPFVLGVADDLDHDVNVPAEYAQKQAMRAFDRAPFVRLRLFNAAVADRKFSPANLEAAVQHFYGEDLGGPDTEDPHLYEQWISLETPAAPLRDESPSDGAYAFHRCLWALNAFLQAFALARSDSRVRPISSRELRPIVAIGSLSKDGTWAYSGPMLMHPDAKTRPVTRRLVAEHAQSLNEALDVILNASPFVRAQQWRARGERRRYEGDAADSIVSFQIAAETLAYELWALLLLDEGLTQSEVQARRDEDVPFASLLKRELASRLGGAWDVTQTSTDVGCYWHSLYLLRNRVIHAGYLPHGGDAEQAERAFVRFDRFLNDRLQATKKKYPGALRARLGS